MVMLQQQVLLAMIDNIRKAKTINHSVAKAISTSNVMQGLATALICSGNFCSHCHKVKVGIGSSSGGGITAVATQRMTVPGEAVAVALQQLLPQ